MYLSSQAHQGVHDAVSKKPSDSEKTLETLRGGGHANASLLSSILLLSLSKHLSWIIKTGKLLKWSHFDMQKKFWETCSVGGSISSLLFNVQLLSRANPMAVSGFFAHLH